jgi:predicted RND superfamily exporter protein
MNRFISAWSNFVIEKRIVVILVSCFALVGGAMFGGNIKFDHSIERNFEQGDAKIEEFNQLLELFGDTEYLVVGIGANKEEQSVFNVGTMKVVDAITDFLERQEAVTQVRSLSKYQFIRGQTNDLVIEDLFHQQRAMETDSLSLKRASSLIVDEKLALGILVSKDLTQTRIAARIAYNKASPAHKVALVQSVYQFVEEQGFTQQGYRIRYSGQPVFDEQFETRNKKDAEILYPVMALIMIIVLFLGFRSWYATLMPWLAIISGIVILSGIQGWLGFPHSAVDQALIPTMIIVGIGISMHVTLEFYRLRNKQETSIVAAKKVVQILWTPAFYTALTTAVGFITLSLTKIVPVKEMAILGAAGTLVLFLVAFSLLPALLSYSTGLPKPTSKMLDSGWITKLTQKIPKFTSQQRYPILFVAIVLSIYSGLTVPNIKIDTNFVEYFKTSNTARQDLTFFDEKFNGALTMEVILDSGKTDGIKQPQFLNRVEQLQVYLEKRKSTGEITSLVDYVKEIHQSINEEKESYYTVPDNKNKVAQLLFLYENSGPEEDLSDIRDFDNRYLRMTVPMINMPASEMQVELDTIRSHIQKNFNDLDITLTGIKLLFQTQDIYSNEGMFKSFSVTLLVISLFFIVLFRSLKYGLLCVIPSVLPIMITGGTIALLGLNLDLGTMIVGAMTMGIAVDDSIHVMNRYLRAKKDGEETQKAISLAMSEAGRAVIFSSIVLVLGFSVLTLGSFVPIIYVGLFSACIMFLALVGDLFVLPAMLHILDGKKLASSVSEGLKESKNIA